MQMEDSDKNVEKRRPRCLFKDIDALLVTRQMRKNQVPSQSSGFGTFLFEFYTNLKFPFARRVAASAKSFFMAWK